MADDALRPGRSLGVDHIGVGVSDMERSLRFYADLGFTDVAFDCHTPLPGLGRVAGRGGVEAHVVMLRPSTPTPLGPAAVKLVQTTDAPPPPMPEGMGWGEPGSARSASTRATRPGSTGGWSTSLATRG